MTLRATNWSLEEGDARRIELLLQTLLHESQARCALLIDRTGQLIAGSGDAAGLDTTAFASLAAADFAANDQLASMLGEQEFSSLFHQGERESMYLVDIARQAILLVLFDQRTPLGMMRIRVRSAARELEALFREIRERAPAGPRPLRLESAWMGEVEGEIDRLFDSR